MLDIDAFDESRASFVRFCDCFNIPARHVRGRARFLPGTDQEYGGIIKHGAKLLFAFAEATVPKVTVIFCAKRMAAPTTSWRRRHISRRRESRVPHRGDRVIGTDGAVNIVRRKEISESKEPEKTRAAFALDYKEKFANPYKAAEARLHRRGHHPRTLRQRLHRSLEQLLKDKRDSNPPKNTPTSRSNALRS